MKSNLKTKLDRAQIENLVKINFPKAKLSNITELEDGNIGSVYVIRMSLNDSTPMDYVLKVGMAAGADCLRYEKDLFATELKVYHLLDNKDIPIPKVLKADLSCEIVPAGYFFMEFIEGRTWKDAAKELSFDDKRHLMKKLGEYNARISSVRGNYFGYLKDGEQHRFKTHSEAFGNMINDVLLDGEERKFDLPYKEINSLPEKYRRLLDEVDEPRLVDFDLWAGNVFLRRGENVEISGIIDFGHCFYGDPYAAFTSAVHIFDNVEEEADFIEGYESVSKEKLQFTQNTRIRMNLYRLYMALLCAVETYRYEEALGNKLRSSYICKVNRLLEKLYIGTY